MKRREFVLIKNYPDSGLIVGDILTFKTSNVVEIYDETHPLNTLTVKVQRAYLLSECEKYPEHWREIYPIRKQDNGN